MGSSFVFFCRITKLEPLLQFVSTTQLSSSLLSVAPRTLVKYDRALTMPGSSTFDNLVSSHTDALAPFEGRAFAAFEQRHHPSVVPTVTPMMSARDGADNRRTSDRDGSSPSKVPSPQAPTLTSRALGRVVRAARPGPNAAGLARRCERIRERSPTFKALRQRQAPAPHSVRSDYRHVHRLSPATIVPSQTRSSETTAASI